MLNLLGGLPLAKLLGGLALVAILSLTILWKAADRRADKWERQVGKLSAELKRISTAKDDQRKETAVNVAEGEKGRKGAKTIADRILASPPTKDCKTPEIIMGADL